MTWLLLAILATVILLGVDHSRWIGNVQANLARLLLLGSGVATRTGRAASSWWTAAMVGLVLGVLVGRGSLGGIPTIDWGKWIPLPSPVGPVDPKPATSIQVLVIEEQADRTGAINNTLNSGVIRDYLATKGKDNYLRLDDESRLELMPEWVRVAAQQRGATPTPAVVIVADGKHYASPLPTSPDAFLALLKKYGG